MIQQLAPLIPSLAGLSVVILISSAASSAEVDFSRQVRPLLSDRCFACHGPDEAHREADLRLDQRLDRLDETAGTRVIVPKHADMSELVRRIESSDDDLRMPPPGSGKPLSRHERELLRTWINEGAEWKQHWAYEEPVPSVVPQLSAPSQPVADNWIDAYIAERFPPDVGFSEPADPVTLLRRLSFDICGLPPDVALTRLIHGPNSAQAIDQVTDQLLSSPAFGERMATYWLDLVRFADTVGYHGDQDHSISPYRDYVIDAFNDNKPFDEFTIEQLAGDLLERPTIEQIIATGYNRLLQTSHEGGVQPKEYLAIYAADRVRNVSAVWMGATVGCAQCHDHKFDPYTAQDFYALSAFFADVDEEQHFSLGSNELPTKRPPEIQVLSRAERLLETRLAEALQSSSTDSARDPTSIELERQLLQSRIDALRKSARATMVTKSVEPRTVKLLPRGNWLDETGPILSPAVPAFLGNVSNKRPRATRLDLATWLTDRETGVGLLTARVFVNRVWMMFFGAGLSRSVEDFGGQGEPPSHPQLLDRLAIEFVESGWDIKRLIRLITTSRAYRQSSLENSWHRSNDPSNIWISRQNRFRMPAEMVRDTSLHCADILVFRVGGASVKPYQPKDYYRHLNFPERSYEHSTDDGQWRRGVYVHWQRQFLHPMLRAFDAPTREECTAQRSPSNTPLAAMVWLNDPSFIEAARGLASRVLAMRTAVTQTTSTIDSKRSIAQIFEICTNRSPDEVESQTLLELLEQSRRIYHSDPAAAKQLLALGMLPVHSQADQIELAAWTMVARAVLNLNEVYTRN